MTDWIAVWNKEIEERKKKIRKIVNTRHNDIEELGNYFQNLIKKWKIEYLLEDRDLFYFNYYFSQEFNQDFEFYKPLPLPNNEIISICTKIINDIFKYNLFHDYQIFTIRHPLTVINLEKQEEEYIYYEKDFVKYIIGLFHQHLFALEHLNKYLLSDIWKTKKIPKKRSLFFAFFLIAFQELFNQLEPWIKSLVFIEYYRDIESFNRPYRYDSVGAQYSLIAFLYALWSITTQFLLNDRRQIFYNIRNSLITRWVQYELEKDHLNLLRTRYEAEINKFLKNAENLEKELDMKYYNLDENQLRIKKQLERRVYDRKHPNAYKLDPLYSLKIPELTPEESKRYGKFKIEKKESKQNLYGIPIEHYVRHTIFQEIDGEWEYVLSHTIYRWEKEIEHGKEYETKDVPLIPYMYVDEKDKIFYIETENGTLYISLNLRNWFDWHVRPEERPYRNRIAKLRKFKIPNYI